MVPSQISSWVRFYWLPLGLTLPGPFFLFVALLCVHFWFSLSLNLDSDRSLPFIFHSSASSHLKCSDPGHNWFRTKLHFVFLLPLKIELQDGIHQCTNPSPHHHPQMLHAFPGLGGLHYHSLPCSSHLTMERTGNGDCSSRKGKSAEIGQCDSEISRRGLSSSLDPPTSAPPAPPWSLLHLFPKPAGINGNYLLKTRENGNILSQRDRKAPFTVYVMLQACPIIESYNILSWEGVQVLTHLLLWKPGHFNNWEFKSLVYWVLSGPSAISFLSLGFVFLWHRRPLLGHFILQFPIIQNSFSSLVCIRK